MLPFATIRHQKLQLTNIRSIAIKCMVSAQPIQIENARAEQTNIFQPVQQCQTVKKLLSSIHVILGAILFNSIKVPVLLIPTII